MRINQLDARRVFSRSNILFTWNLECRDNKSVLHMWKQTSPSEQILLSNLSNIHPLEGKLPPSLIKMSFSGTVFLYYCW